MLSAKKAKKILQDEHLKFAKNFEEKHPEVIKQFEDIVKSYAKAGERCIYCAEITGLYEEDDFVKYAKFLGYNIERLHCTLNGNAFKVSF